MSKKESVLFNFTPDTGMKISKGDIAYSLLSRDYKDNQCIVVLNDQGGKQMDVSYDVTATLRSETHGHLPLVLNAGDNQQAVVMGAIDDTYRKQSN